LTSNVSASRTANPAPSLPSASPSIDITMLSPGMQWTVCGDDSPVLALISPGSMTLWRLGARGSVATSMMWTRDDSMPGTIRYLRSSSQQSNALEQVCQP
jgi:hypothetical protein